MSTPSSSRVRDSVAWWPFCMRRDTELQTRSNEPMPLSTASLIAGLREQCGIAKPVIELAPRADYESLANAGVINAMGFVDPFASAKIPPFVRGLNNLKYRDVVIGVTVEEIDLHAKYQWPNVIAFVGYTVDPTDQDAPIKRSRAMANCVASLKKLAKHAEAKRVVICLEHLSSRDASHPMKGHPGYQGDDLDFVAEIVRRVGSPWVKVLFDIYHVQVMHGDVIRRLRGLLAEGLVGHIHTAGCPDRGELGPTQEIYYPAIMKVVVESGYTGYTGIEHIPTWDDKFKSIANSIGICAV